MPAKYTLHVALTDSLVRYVRGQVATGRHETASDVVRTALQALMERDGTARPPVDSGAAGRRGGQTVSEPARPCVAGGDDLSRHRAIFESAVDFAIIATDRDGLITDWNRGAEAIFGWSAEEMVGGSAERFFTPEDREGGRIAYEMQSALQDGRGNDERWHLRKDGGRFWANGEMMPLRDGSGAHLGFLKIVRDETEKHAAAEKQRADREFMHGVLAASNDCIKVLDLNGHLTFMSEGGQRTMEVSDFNEIRGCPWPDFWQGPGHADAEAALETAKAGGVARFQGPADTVAGTPRYWDVQVTPIMGPDGRPERLLSISRDVTATWQAQTNLRQSQDQLAFERNLLQAVFQQAPVGISVAGADPQVPNMVNGRAEAMLGHGIGPKDASRYENYGAVHPDGRPYAAAEYPSMRALRQGEFVHAEDMLYRQGGTGEQRLFEVSSSPVRDGAGRIQAAATVFADVTDRRRAERQLRRLALIAEQSSDFIGIADVEGRVEYVNPAGRALVGLVDAAAARASRVADYFLPEDLPFVEASILPPVLAGGSWSGDFRFRDFTTGAPVPVRYNQFSLKGERGEFEGYAAVSHDISARKAAEAQQDIIHRELAHRLKNTLAMVQAIVTQTLRSTPDVAAARDALASRLYALGKAHDLLITGQREGAEMQLLIEDALKLHDDGRPGRLSVDGPPVFCCDRSALSLVLMMHELATNAAKYGALRSPDGSVAIAWTLDGDAAAPDLRLTWEEHGGPPVAAPTRRGFGSRLIERGLAGTVGGEVSIDYPPSGVTCTLVAPLSGFTG